MSELLWTPPAELVENGDDDALHACGRPRPRRLRGAVAVVGRRPRGLLARDLGLLRRAGRRRPVDGARLARDAGRAVVPGRRGSPTPSTSSAASATTTSRSCTRASGASWASGPGASCARETARVRAGLRAPGVGRGRPRRRLHAEHPRDDRGVPRDRVARRGLVVAARPTSARAASSTASRRSSRRCCSPSTATATAARTSTAPTSSRSCRREMPTLEHTEVAALSGRGRELASPTPPDEPLEFERVPFDHPLWVLYSSGTTGLPKAIVHGQGGILLEHLKKMHLHVDAQDGDRVFWFTTTGWMMWNFLVGVLLTDGRDRALRRQPRHAGPGRALGPRRGGRDHAASAPAPRSSRLHEGRRRAGRRPRPRSAARGRLDRLAAGARGLPVGLRPPRRGHLAVLDLRRHRRLHRLRRRHAARARSTAASCRRARSAPTSQAFDEEGNALVDEVGELVITEPMPSMPVFFWNDHDGERYRESYFDMYPGVWRHGDWIRITDARHGDHLRPLRLDDQPRRHPHGHERDLPRGARARRDRRRAGRRRPVDGRQGVLDAAVRRAAEGAELDDDLIKRDRAAHPRGLLAAPRPERGRRRRRGPAHAVGQGARGPGQEDPHGHRPRAGRVARLARQPGRARLVRRVGALARLGRARRVDRLELDRELVGEREAEVERRQRRVV